MRIKPFKAMNECSHKVFMMSVHAKQCDEVAEINESLIPAATFTNLMHYELWKGSSIKGNIVQCPAYQISNMEICANRK